MKKKVLVSVILPVYNAALTIHRCINSILKQTFNEFELIVVNDGSSDGSAEICDAYADTDARIKVVHKKNGGVSSARQVGIELASGEYSIHVDSDDYVDSQFIECLYCEAMRTNADIVICDYYYEKGSGCFERIAQDLFDKDSKFFLQQILSGERMGALWNKLIRHGLYKINEIRFTEELFYCEDVFVLSKILCRDVALSNVDKALYYYTNQPLSITRQVSRKTVANRQLFISMIELFFLENGLNFDLRLHKADIKVDMVKSGLFSFSEVAGIYKDVDICIVRKKVGFKLLYFCYFLSMHKSSYAIMRILIKILRLCKRMVR